MSTQEPVKKRSHAADLVVETDTGARRPDNVIARNVLVYTALAWSLFQLWVASPLPFELNIFILNNTETRSIHLAFAVFLAFLAYPMSKRSPRHHIPIMDWVLALAAAFCASYIYVFYEQLSTRPGLPTDVDIYVACFGMVLLLEATRRALGPPLMIVAMVFLFYTFAGAWDIMPDLISHKGQSLGKVASHQWLTTEGVYGVALGVSTDFVFLFVLFGALLDKAGAGNYFIKLAFSMMGHMRGGPAKAAVLSSAMTGLISGSSIANVVTTGTFTIPLMRRVGFSREKAGAVEVAASVNGQIMPPVMGAAAFLMVEYIGIPYIDVIRHAFLPAIISYIALLYMVHLEAMKADMPVLERTDIKPLKLRMLVWGLVVSSGVIFVCATYYVILGLKVVSGDYTQWTVSILIATLYLTSLYFRARFPDLEVENEETKMQTLPGTWATFRTGLHFLLPIIVLVWCLMIEHLSPGLSAFWATVLMMFILATQRPLTALFRKVSESEIKTEFTHGLADLRNGLITGARNMIGIGVATAAAGIIVGTVSLTGVGQVMTEIVEVLSGGSFVMVLILTAFICLILGMGLPTTANYIVVASIMTPVIVELGAQSGMLVPLIAVHMFVFYFGIMADVTPPVGLASFAAAAVSGGDPIKTGVQAFIYSSRTVILPFIFMYNHELLMVGVDSFWHGLGIFIVSTIAILVFSAAMQGYFQTRNRWYETGMLILIAFALFNPKVLMNQLVDPYRQFEPSAIEDAAAVVPEDGRFRVFVRGFDEIGDEKEFYAILHLEAGGTGLERLEQAGILLRYEDDGAVMIEDVGFNSAAESAGLEFDSEILGVEAQQPQPNKRFMYIPAFVLMVLVIIMQRRRMRESNRSAKPKNTKTTKRQKTA